MAPITPLRAAKLQQEWRDQWARKAAREAETVGLAVQRRVMIAGQDGANRPVTITHLRGGA